MISNPSKLSALIFLSLIFTKVKMSLLEKIETNEKISEEKRKEVDKEVKKLREYDKLGFVGGA